MPEPPEEREPSDAKNHNPDSSHPTRLKIWEEVERRFEHPPSSFTDRIENEVDRRLKRQLRQYYLAATVLVGLIGWILHEFHKTTVSAAFLAARDTTASMLASNEAVKNAQQISLMRTQAQSHSDQIPNLMESAQADYKIFADRLAQIKQQDNEATKNAQTIALLRAQAQLHSDRISNLTESVQADYTVLTDRFAQIKQQDNVILIDDLSKLFVVETVTALVDGTTIVLKYDPIPQTVRVAWAGQQSYPPARWKGSHIEGHSIVFTNLGNLSLSNMVDRYGLTVSYVRASKTDR